MTGEIADLQGSEVELDEVIFAYLREVEAGRCPDRAEWLNRHPSLAAALREFFADQDGFERLAAEGAVLTAALPCPGAGAWSPDHAPAHESRTASSSMAGGVLGDFELEEELGRGGMGVVYKARQKSLNRAVALKVLPFAATMDPRQLQRFHNEAQAAANLHHTNIVPVYYVGSERGVHYYAMQLIAGRDLASVLAQLRQPAGGKKAAPMSAPTVNAADGAAVTPATVDTQPIAGLSTEGSTRPREYFRTAARLGIQAAEALDHAHQQGIVHRDVKPANLLVDAAGRLWVTDFGLAQMQTDTRLTMTGDLVGTLRYMSPEQALAKRVIVDHRADIYSLGATLYELLTLEPPFRGADRHELLRQIAFEDPKLPRRIDKAVPRELETIVLKALEKNPADRYATAQELADDLERWLKDEPIRARKPGLVQRARKWTRRHRPVTSATAVVLMLAAVFGGGTWLRWNQLWAQKRTGAEVAARAALDEASRLGQAERWPEALSATKRAREVLAGVGANPDLRQEVEELGKDLEMARRLQEASLERAAVKDEHFDWEATDAAYAEAFQWYGLDVERLDPGEAGERIRSRAIRAQLVAALDDWADVRCRLGGRNWRAFVAVARAADPDPWRDRLRAAFKREDFGAVEKLLASAPQDELPPGTAVFLARVVAGTGTAERAVDVLFRIRSRHPADFWVNFELGMCLESVRPPRLEEAICYLTAAVALRPESAGVRTNLGDALREKVQLDAAITEHRAAIALDPKLAKAHNNLGSALQAKGQLDPAIEEYQAAIALDPKSAKAHNNLANALQAKGQLDAAVTELRAAIALDPKYAALHNNLANALQDKQELDAAIEEYRAAIALDRQAAAPHNNLGNAMQRKGQLDVAIEEYRAAIALDAKYADPHRNLGVALQAKGQLDAAITEFRAAIALEPKLVGATGQLQLCEQCRALDQKLDAILEDKEKPAEAERLALAWLCQQPFKNLNAASARFYAEAFAHDSKLSGADPSDHRYNAACAAALASSGQGKDAANLEAKEYVRLRGQALAWLRAELTARQKMLAKEPDKQGPDVWQTMQHLQQDPDFASVRGDAALAKLPEAEHQDWQKLWQEVEELKHRAAEPSKP